MILDGEGREPEGSSVEEEWADSSMHSATTAVAAMHSLSTKLGPPVPRARAARMATTAPECVAAQVLLVLHATECGSVPEGLQSSLVQTVVRVYTTT